MKDEKEHMSNEGVAKQCLKPIFFGTRTLKNIQKPDINLQVNFNRNEMSQKQLP